MTRRPLDAEEQAAWNRIVRTVKPLVAPSRQRPAASETPAVLAPETPAKAPQPKQRKRAVPVQLRKAAPVKAPAVASSAAASNHGLDSHWDRRLKRGALTPEIELDLHGLGLGHAYDRLDAALEQAVLTGVRTILLVTGRARGHDRASGEGRGAIRAAVGDWLSASRHASHIASVRGAHPRHGGQGALYIILKRSR